MYNKPYISFVVTSRNDNHGDNPLLRTQAFINSLSYQAEKNKLPIEILFVEWNPPSDKPLLKDVLVHPDNEYILIRYVVVPSEIHQQYHHSYSIPLFQMTAKNVGIRRALADFICCTNIDLLFSNDLFEILSRRNLEKGCFYRCNRCDVPSEIVEIREEKKQLEFAERNILARHGFDGSRVGMVGAPDWLAKYDTVVKIIQPLISTLRKRADRIGYEMSKVDYNACGDFTMMHREDWIKIEGYPELDLYSIHIDSMALNAAVALKLNQVIFPPKACAYHIDHKEGWASMDPLETLKFVSKRPGIDWSVMFHAGKQIIKEGITYGINSKDWGFANERFKEYIFEPGKEMREIN
jgi:hypothetical protein